MTFQAYSFREKKKVNIVSDLKLKDYLLKNGNKVVIASGKSKKGDFIASIVSNSKSTEVKKKPSNKKSSKKAPKGSMCA